MLNPVAAQGGGRGGVPPGGSRMHTPFTNIFGGSEMIVTLVTSVGTFAVNLVSGAVSLLSGVLGGLL